MAAEIQESFEKRFRMRVVLPGLAILLITAGLCTVGLITAGRSADALTREGHTYEATRAIMREMDQVATAQEAVGLCERCIEAVTSGDLDQNWYAVRIAARLFALYDISETHVLDERDRPMFTAVQGHAASTRIYERIAPRVQRLVDLTRGRTQRPDGLSNWNERLPHSPIPPFNIARTSPGTVHATDLLRIGERVGIVSVMRMVAGDARAPGADKAPLLVNVRWFDASLLARLRSPDVLAYPRFSDVPRAEPGEIGMRVRDSQGTPVTNLFWRPELPAAETIRSLLPLVGALLAAIALLVIVLGLKLRRLMLRDDERIEELERAHLELKAKEAQAHHLAYHDVLTGLPNRALFNDNADKAMARARHGIPVAVLLLDLDRFKNVNDRFGHFAGDALIQEVARRLTRLVGRADAVARLGGDEFAILLQDQDLQDSLETMLNRILEDLRRPYDILGHQAHIGVSIGVALAPDCGTDRSDLMRKADIALYRAKDEGRDCYRFFTAQMDETVQLRAVLEADLRAAIASGTGLTVHYQPLIDIRASTVSGLEALLRWHHPTRGWIPPHMFVPVAEETGLIGALGDWVLARACEVAREWPGLSIAVNLSPVQFCDEHFVERVCGIVRAAGVPARQIEFEVTESVVLDQNDSVRAQLRQLRAEGFRVALDDFGTGYSSLGQLREFEVDRIKIDRSFIQSLWQNADAGAIISAVVTLGHAMGLQVTAEGVETADQQDFLKVTGCNVMQGFLFSRPVPAHQLRDSLGRRVVEEAA
jgi:diguanylate cyclase (GGDEF)-like protein